MPLDSYVARRLATVPDVSIEELLTDPVQRKRILEGSLDERLRVRLYRPGVAARGSGLVRAHGGGFLGTPLVPEVDATLTRSAHFVAG